jgi:hypothetical protein
MEAYDDLSDFKYIPNNQSAVRRVAKEDERGIAQRESELNAHWWEDSVPGCAKASASYESGW